MKAKQKTRRRFKLGKISTSKPAKRVLLEQEVGKAIRRHAAGDYGAAGTTLWRKNDIAAKEGEGRILSIYESKSGKRFWICTDYGHQSTTVSLARDYELPRRQKGRRLPRIRLFGKWMTRTQKYQYAIVFLLGVLFHRLCLVAGEVVRNW